MQVGFAHIASGRAYLAIALAASASAVQALPSTASAATGAWSHSVPIEVPSYFGIEPKLTFSYLSTQTTGILGVGWELLGLSTITKSATRKTEDGHDLYYLDGEPLEQCVSNAVGASCATGGTHTTRRESYKRIALGTSGWWTVESTDGSIAEYSSSDLPGNRSRQWRLSRVADVRGHSVQYSWNCPSDDAQGRCYPDTIAYNIHHPTVVRFLYAMRTDSLSYAYDDGIGTYKKILTAVDITVDGLRLRVYAVRYSPSGASGRSMLMTIQEFGKDATVDGVGAVTAGTSMPAQSFTYTDQAPLGWDIRPQYAAPPEVLNLLGGQTAAPLPHPDNIMFIDLNGDGVRDLVTTNTGSTDVWFNTPSGWAKQTNYLAFSLSGGLQQADIDGDGNVDLVDPPVVYLNVPGVGLVHSNLPCAPHGGGEYVDLDGDGRDDFVYIDELERHAWLNKAGPSGPNWVPADLYIAQLPVPLKYLLMQPLDFGVRWVDLNGDGRPDVVQGYTTGRFPPPWRQPPRDCPGSVAEHR